jgi:hypothetical protein
LLQETVVNIAEKFQDEYYNLLDPQSPVPTPLPNKESGETVEEKINGEFKPGNTDDGAADFESDAPRERELRVEFSEPPVEYEDQSQDADNDDN